MLHEGCVRVGVILAFHDGSVISLGVFSICGLDPHLLDMHDSAVHARTDMRLCCWRVKPCRRTRHTRYRVWSLCRLRCRQIVLQERRCRHRIGPRERQ